MHRLRKLCVFFVCAFGAGAFTGTAAADPPAGATALCRDGTYSFSLTHSGTCSHHGGVAQWLDMPAPAPTPATSSPSANVVGAIGSTSGTVGSTVLLGAKTRTARCVLGTTPDRTCSPGAYSSGLTAAIICSAGFRTSSIRNVPQSEKYAVEQEYGLAPRHYGHSLEIDHIVPLELGGSNDIANLFPEQVPGFRSKDRLENALHAWVCSGRIDLAQAQRRIATGWPALYADVFGTEP